MASSPLPSLEERVRQSSRRGSAIAITSNPLEDSVSSLSGQIKLVNLSDCRPVSPEELSALVTSLRSMRYFFPVSPCFTMLCADAPAHEFKLSSCFAMHFSDNQSVLEALEAGKDQYLFTSAELIQLMDTTTSLKTKLAMVTMIGPRVTDPKAGMDKVSGVFRYAEEKAQVEEVFKARLQTLSGSMFSRGSSQMMSPQGGRGGRGRGRASRTSSITDSSSEAAKSTSEVAEEVVDEVVSAKPFGG